MNILGINVSELKPEGLWLKIQELLADGRPHYLVTPNPEIILASHHDEEFFYILNEADLAPADGFGLKIAAWLNGQNLSRISGSDLSPKLLELAAKKNLKVAVINWTGGLSSQEEIKAILRQKYPQLDSLVIDSERNQELKSEDRKRLEDFQAKIMFVALGAPYQEKFIWHNLNRLPGLSLALGVGGTFDFLTGKIKRAPKLMRTLGLEWLWRLIRQPQRYRRIFRATVVFSYKVFRSRFIYPYFYRPNVACWLYRRQGDGYEVLIVERQDEAEHWQLPQGGTDGQNLTRAGARKLSEELGTEKFAVKTCYHNVFRYTFASVGQKKKLNSRVNQNNYKGQKQGLCIAEFQGQDSDIKVNFWDHRAWAWVKAEEVADKVNSCRQAGARIFAAKFQEYLENEHHQ